MEPRLLQEEGHRQQLRVLEVVKRLLQQQEVRQSPHRVLLVFASHMYTLVVYLGVIFEGGNDPNSDTEKNKRKGYYNEIRSYICSCHCIQNRLLGDNV